MPAKNHTKADKVYVSIQSQIISGNIRAGSRLVISRLAKEFAVSEIPIREALQRLAEAGYLKLMPYSGAIVTGLSREEVVEIFEIRIELESLATKKAIDHLSNAHLNAMEAFLEQSKEILKSGDLSSYGGMNRAFHESIYQHCHNSKLISYISELWNFSSRYPSPFFNMTDIEQSILEHATILQALRERDAVKAEEQVRKHKTKALHRIIQLLMEQSSNEESSISGLEEVTYGDPIY